jgi:hypothetical protein
MVVLGCVVLAGCVSRAAKPAAGDVNVRVERWALFNYDGIRCSICHKAVKPEHAPVCHLAFDGGPVLYAHAGCWDAVRLP